MVFKTTNNVGGTGNLVVTRPVLRSALCSDFKSAIEVVLKSVGIFMTTSEQTWNNEVMVGGTEF